VACNLRPSAVAEVVAKSVVNRLLGLPAEDWVGYHKGELAAWERARSQDRKLLEAYRKRDTKPSREQTLNPRV